MRTYALIYKISKHDTSEATQRYRCVAFINDEKVCECTVNVANNIWTIVLWHTEDKFKHKGFGTKTLRTLLRSVYRKHGNPNRVEYVWNGLNKYVLDWLVGNFEAVCNCPIAIQKYQSDDDWDSHIYILNTSKVMQFMEEQ